MEQICGTDSYAPLLQSGFPSTFVAGEVKVFPAEFKQEYDDFHCVLASPLLLLCAYTVQLAMLSFNMKMKIFYVVAAQLLQTNFDYA